MSISYFNCDNCDLEMNDCYGNFAWWLCSNCDATYCDDCVTGKWVTCECSGFDYCESCLKAGQVCDCGSFECRACQGENVPHTPGCAVRPVRAVSREE